MRATLDHALRDLDPVDRARVDGWSHSPEGHRTLRRVTGAVAIVPRRPRRPWKNAVAALAAVLVLVVATVVFAAPWGSQTPAPLQGMAGRLVAGHWQILDAGPATGFIDPWTTWTGTEFVVFAHDLGAGAAFDPQTGTWRTIATPPLRAASFTAAPVWTGDEIVVWGTAPAAGSRAGADGAAYSPKTDSWRALSLAPIAVSKGATALWAGREIVVIGGNATPCTAAETCRSAVGAYDPGTDVWRSLPPLPAALGHKARVSATWDGTAVVIAVTRPHGSFAARWEPGSPEWERLPEISSLPRKHRLVIVDGSVVDIAQSAATSPLGASRLDRAKDVWSPIATLPAEASCGGRAVAIPHGAVVLCAHRDQLVLDAGGERWGRLPVAPLATEPARWTGRELIAMSDDGQSLLRLVPGPVASNSRGA
jgi:hypothetical protein